MINNFNNVGSAPLSSPRNHHCPVLVSYKPVSYKGTCNFVWCPLLVTLSCTMIDFDGELAPELPTVMEWLGRGDIAVRAHVRKVYGSSPTRCPD